jgi:hypothetical protein
MIHRRIVIASAVALGLSLGACRAAAVQALLPVGTCVQVVEGGGTTAVPCADPHTHMVIAIAASAEACPIETDMFSQPADPDDGAGTTCFKADPVAE